MKIIAYAILMALNIILIWIGFAYFFFIEVFAVMLTLFLLIMFAFDCNKKAETEEFIKTKEIGLNNKGMQQ